MVWQDWVIMLGGLVITAGLIPILFDSEKPTLKASIPVAVVMSIYVYTFLTLGLWLSALGLLGQAVIWTVIGIQRIKCGRVARADEGAVLERQ